MKWTRRFGFWRKLFRSIFLFCFSNWKFRAIDSPLFWNLFSFYSGSFRKILFWKFFFQCLSGSFSFEVAEYKILKERKCWISYSFWDATYRLKKRLESSIKEHSCHFRRSHTWSYKIFSLLKLSVILKSLKFKPRGLSRIIALQLFVRSTVRQLQAFLGSTDLNFRKSSYLFWLLSLYKERERKGIRHFLRKLLRIFGPKTVSTRRTGSEWRGRSAREQLRHKAPLIRCLQRN